MKIKIGKGLKDEHSHTCAVGGIEAELEDVNAERTFASLAKQLAKQIGLEDGNIIIYSVHFNYEK
jgi:hypothetical protein